MVGAGRLGLSGADLSRLASNAAASAVDVAVWLPRRRVMSS